MIFRSLLLILCPLLFANCTGIDLAEAEICKAKPTGPRFVKTGHSQHGRASWYSIACNGGRHTASMEALSDHANTAAHKSLPMGSWVRVTNLRNGKSEVVRINDRGPYIRGRIIDVTIGVARKLDFVHSGVVPVKVDVLQKVM